MEINKNKYWYSTKLISPNLQNLFSRMTLDYKFRVSVDGNIHGSQFNPRYLETRNLYPKRGGTKIEPKCGNGENK